MDFIQIAIGAGGVVGLAGVGYVLYLAKTKGVPAAVAWVKAKWNAGKADLETVKADVAFVQTKLASLETVALADIKSRLASVEGILATSKPAAPAPAAAAPIGPA